MTKSETDGNPPAWLSSNGNGTETFAKGEVWVGQHTVDEDILVFDPSESDPSAPVLDLYSLTQHRTRRFPRAIVLQRIQTLTDELAEARAKREYGQRDSLRESHEQELEAARTERFDQVRAGITDAHRRHLDSLGIEYQGTRDSESERRVGRATKCHVCGIELDGFVGVECLVCSTSLCSCGACACGRPTRKKAKK